MTQVGWQRVKLPRFENWGCPDRLWRSERCFRSSKSSSDQVFLQINLAEGGHSSVLNISTWVKFPKLGVSQRFPLVKTKENLVLITSKSLSFGAVVSVMFAVGLGRSRASRDG